MLPFRIDQRIRNNRSPGLVSTRYVPFCSTAGTYRHVGYIDRTHFIKGRYCVSIVQSPCALIRQPLKHFGNSLAASVCTLVPDNVGVVESRRLSPLHIFDHYPSTMNSRRPWSAGNVLLPVIAYRRIGACLGVYGALARFRSTACLV